MLTKEVKVDSLINSKSMMMDNDHWWCILNQHMHKVSIMQLYLYVLGRVLTEFILSSEDNQFAWFRISLLA